jgi:hypothetical protein
MRASQVWFLSWWQCCSELGWQIGVCTCGLCDFRHDRRLLSVCFLINNVKMIHADSLWRFHVIIYVKCLTLIKHTINKYGYLMPKCDKELSRNNGTVIGHVLPHEGDTVSSTRWALSVLMLLLLISISDKYRLCQLPVMFLHQSVPWFLHW